MKSSISTYCAKIGRRGGRASTPAKRTAARLNALKRWHRNSVTVLPVEALEDRTWYRGEGRNSTIGLWDARAKCFWTVAVNDFSDPALFPAKSLRKVRLKREDYFCAGAGTFKPVAAVVP